MRYGKIEVIQTKDAPGIHIDYSGSNATALSVSGGDLDVAGGAGSITAEGSIISYGVGDPTTDDSEYFQITYDPDAVWRLTSGQVGTGVARSIQFDTESASAIPLIVKGTTSQSAQLTEWRDSEDHVLASMGVTSTWAGLLSLKNAYSGTYHNLATDNAGTFSIYTGNSGLSFNGQNNPVFLTIGNAVGSYASELRPTGNFTIVSPVSTAKPLIIKGAASQSANLQEWQDSSGTVLVYVTADGNLVLNRYNATLDFEGNNGNKIRLTGDSRYCIYVSSFTLEYKTDGTHRFTGSNTSYPLMVVVANSGQTANLQEWQNSSSTVLASVSSAGVFSAQKIIFDIGSGTFGPGSVDFQVIRNNYNEIASGDHSFCQGIYCKASGNQSYAQGRTSWATGLAAHAEGDSTLASGSRAHAEGISTTASGDYSHSEGNATTASGANSHAEGESTAASGQASHAEGFHTTASSNYSHAEGSYTVASGVAAHAEGAYTLAAGQSSHAQGESSEANGDFSSCMGHYSKSDLHGQHSHAAGVFNDRGDSQYSRLVALNVTTDATPTLIRPNKTLPIALANATAWTFDIQVIARNTAGSSIGSWKSFGCIYRNANAASTTLVGEDTTAINVPAGWAFAVTADTTNGALALTVTGEADVTIRWVATIQLTQVQN